MAADPETQGHRAWELKTSPFLPKQLLAGPILSSEAICLGERKAYDSPGPHFMPARRGTRPQAVGGTISKMLLGGLPHSGVCPGLPHSGVCPAQKAVKARNSLTKPLLILPHTPRRGPLAHASGDRSSSFPPPLGHTLLNFKHFFVA